MVTSKQPPTVFDPLLQHERTALAWERTAIAAIVAGLLFVRTVAQWHTVLAVIGFGQVVFGAGLLLWAGRHYESLHGPLRAGENPLHPTAAGLVGLATVLFTGLSTAVAAVAMATGWW